MSLTPQSWQHGEGEDDEASVFYASDLKLYLEAERDRYRHAPSTSAYAAFAVLIADLFPEQQG